MASVLPHKDMAQHESLLPTCCPEKAQHRTEPGPKRTMSSRRLAFALFFCFLVTYGFAAAISPRYRLSCNYDHHGQVTKVVAEEPQAEAPPGSLSALLNSVSPDALHEMLHAHFPDRYQHGIYESDRKAVEAVHADNPALASRIIQIAKRQTNSTTTPSTSQTSTDNTTPTSTPTTVHTSTTPTSSTSTTSQGPNTTGSTTQTTPTTTAKKSSSLVTATFTSTAPNGQVTVVTATSYVEANPTASSTTGAAGSIQTGNSAPGNPAGLPAWAGVLLGGLLLI